MDEAGTRGASDCLDGALSWILPLRVRRCRRRLNSSIVVEFDHRVLCVHLVVIRENEGDAPILARPTLPGVVIPRLKKWYTKQYHLVYQIGTAWYTKLVLLGTLLY